MDVLQNLTLMIPSFEEQNKIARILKVIDDKIALNRQINDNLPPHQKRKYAEKTGCGGNEETAQPFSSLHTAA